MLIVTKKFDSQTAICRHLQLLGHDGFDVTAPDIELIVNNITREFQTTVVKPLLSLEDVRSIKKFVPTGSTHRLQKFRSEYALDPALRKYGDVSDDRDLYIKIGVSKQ